jgi:hypothetical protein
VRLRGALSPGAIVAGRLPSGARTGRVVSVATVLPGGFVRHCRPNCPTRRRGPWPG